MKYDFSILESDRLLLRKLCKSDAEQMYNNWASSEKVTKYLTWPRHKSIEESKEILDIWEKEYESGMNYRWGIVYKENDCLIGTIDTVYLDLENRIAGIGYVISEEYWGKGLVTEALELVLEYLIMQEGFIIVKANHDIDNPASGKVMEKAGMKFESIVQKGYIKGNKEAGDLICYSITKKDWLRKFCRKNN